jgi:alkylated DNA repair dioxygenase AlkB
MELPFPYRARWSGMTGVQFSLLEAAPPVPEGLSYRGDLITAEEESALADAIAGLDLAPFEFLGFLGKRRVASFGWQYVFDGSGLRKAGEIPGFLLGVREKAAAFAGVAADDFQHALVTEYAPGAGIGWHRDRSVFGDVVGISLLAPARIRFRRRMGKTWARADLAAAPRSAYLLKGPARADWEHSIPEMESLRYSITFRTLRPGAAA